MHSIFDFVWPVSEAGYVWQCCATAEAIEKQAPLDYATIAKQLQDRGRNPPDFAKYLRSQIRLGIECSTELVQVDPQAPQRVTRPLEDERGLFRMFAGLETTCEAFIGFANRYGDIKAHAYGVYDEEYPPGSERRALRENIAQEGKLGLFISGGFFKANRGATVGVWRDAVRELRESVDWWDAIQAKDLNQLSKRIGWLDDFPFSQWSRFPITSRSAALKNRIDGNWRHGDLIGPAKALLRRDVSYYFENKSLRLNLLPTSAGGERLVVSPLSLLDTIWLQFALAIEEDRRYRTCDQCGRWFEVSLEAERPNKMYCDKACKMRAYRRKIAEAQRLHAQGTPPSKIARELKTETETVRGWLQLKGESDVNDPKTSRTRRRRHLPKK